MPIDEDAQRRSIAGLPPEPDGSIDASDRAAIAGLPIRTETAGSLVIIGSSIIIAARRSF